MRRPATLAPQATAFHMARAARAGACAAHVAALVVALARLAHSDGDASLTWGSGAEGPELGMRASAPALRVGPLRLRGTLFTRERGGFGGRSQVADVVGEGRLEWGAARVAWLEWAQGHHDGSGPVTISPLLGAGVSVPVRAFTWTSAIRHWTARIPRPPVWIYTWPPTLQGLPGPWPPSFTDYSDVLPFWMTMPPRIVHATEAQSALRWTRSTLDLELRTGMIAGTGVPRVQLSAVDATFWCLPGLALTLTAGPPVRAPEAGDFVGYPEFAMGLRFEPGHAAHRSAARSEAEHDSWRLRPLDAGRASLELWSPGAESVELRGDLTGWSASSMRRGAGGWWRLALPVPPGVHQVQVRIDGGAWEPPPGLPIEPAGFGGRAGMLIAE
ncbi:MAG TPA: glycogen-binding domain-containing protein [Candidatus Eisenbacteria bacterium]|nr:glycogen-binding domain-containing protein [Candidatus Eisenbacteria bacterium]